MHRRKLSNDEVRIIFGPASIGKTKQLAFQDLFDFADKTREEIARGEPFEMLIPEYMGSIQCDHQNLVDNLNIRIQYLKDQGVRFLKKEPSEHGPYGQIELEILGAEPAQLLNHPKLKRLSKLLDK